MQLQLVPPYTHWHNAAEQAVRTFNNQFIATLCTVEPHLPFYL